MSKPTPDPMFAAVIRAAGSQAAYGTTFGRPQQSISDRLRSGKPIWPEDVLKAEAAFGVSRHDLRPDLYPRESITADQDAA